MTERTDPKGLKRMDPKELIASAKHAAEKGLTFDEFCLIITKIIVSGQTLEEVTRMFIKAGIDEIFE